MKIISIVVGVGGQGENSKNFCDYCRVDHCTDFDTNFWNLFVVTDLGATVTVGELIEQLSKMDSKALVVIHDRCDITDVEVFMPGLGHKFKEECECQSVVRLYASCLCGDNTL
jgi:hypothetical protein